MAAATITTRPTVDDVIEQEPRVGELIAAARAEPDPWWPEYSDYKARLSSLVGWDAPPTASELVRSSAAYETCIDAMVEGLRL